MSASGKSSNRRYESSRSYHGIYGAEYRRNQEASHRRGTAAPNASAAEPAAPRTRPRRLVQLRAGD